MSIKIMSIQAIAEKLLKKHKINLEAETYYIKLQKPHYLDLVIERQGSTVFVGHYYTQNGDLISDPVLVMDHNGGNWYPVRIEQIFGNTTCSYMQGEQRMISKRHIRDFRSFQAMFARNIKDQDWLDESTRYIEA